MSGDVTVRLTLPRQVMDDLRRRAASKQRTVNDELAVALRVWLKATEPGVQPEPNVELTRLLVAVKSARADGFRVDRGRRD